MKQTVQIIVAVGLVGLIGFAISAVPISPSLMTAESSAAESHTSIDALASQRRDTSLANRLRPESVDDVQTKVRPSTGENIDSDTDEDLLDYFDVIGELPDRVSELAPVLHRLHGMSVRTFESSPLFGNYRNAPQRPKPKSERKPLDSPVPDATRSFRNNLDGELHFAKSTEYGIAWMWFREMRGFTSRGFVYRITDPAIRRQKPDLTREESLAVGRLVVGLPDTENAERFLKDICEAVSTASLEKSDRVWDVKTVQLVSLLKHDSPRAYLKRREIGFGAVDDGKEEPTRPLDSRELASLKRLLDGAECVLDWNDEVDRLQMLGAIRASEKCLKCHEVKKGDLLGAFTYWIVEQESPSE